MKKNTNNSMELIISKLNSIEAQLKGEQDTTMTFNQVCEYLGISKSYGYKLTMQGRIPHYKTWGKKLFFSKIEIDQFIKQFRGGKV